MHWRILISSGNPSVQLNLGTTALCVKEKICLSFRHNCRWGNLYSISTSLELYKKAKVQMSVTIYISFLGPWNTLSQTWWLRKTETYSQASRGQKSEISITGKKSRSLQGHTLPRGSRGESAPCPFQPLLAADIFSFK